MDQPTTPGPILPPAHKCTNVNDAIARYGYIDFSQSQNGQGGYWHDQGLWIGMLAIPAGLCPGWKVLDTQMPVQHIACNKDMMEPLMTVLENLSARGMQWLLKTFDGCFNIRMVRGTTDTPSTHSYGLAIDINAATNPLGATQGGIYTAPKFVECFTEQGFDWGGNFHGRKDPMHFSYAWE